MKKTLLLSSAILVSLATAVTAKADGVPSLTAGQSGLPRMDVVDISSGNGNLSVANFQAMKKYGVKAVIVKLTESVTYHNPYAQSQLANAKAAGLQVGAYEFSWFNNAVTSGPNYISYNNQSAIAEANYFAAYAKQLGLPGNTPMFDDVEEGFDNVPSITTNMQAFANQLKANGYSRPMHYVGQYFSPYLNLAALGYGNIWMPQYPYSPSSANLWNTQYAMWQWNSNTHFPGVPGAFDVSIDYKGVFGGSATGGAKTGQQYINGHWYLYNNAGTMQTGFQNLASYGQNKTVYYDANGQMLYGQQKINGHWYLFDKTTGAMQTGFQNLAAYGQAKTVYYNPSNGQMLYGQQNIAGHWYLFDKTLGSMMTGFQSLSSYGRNATVYYASNGQMLYGLQAISGATYYLLPGWGNVTTGQHLINGHWYLFNTQGIMQTGFQNLAPYGQAKTAYYNPTNGQMLYGQQKISGFWYLFDKTTGAMQTGFQNLAAYGQDKAVYYNPTNGQMLYGQQEIGGSVYFFNMTTGALS